MKLFRLPTGLAMFIGCALAVGCSSPTYVANRAAVGEPAAELTLDPTVRIATLDGEAVDELPIVGLVDMRRNKGTNVRRIRLTEGSHELLAGVGPFFVGNRNTYQNPNAIAPSPMGGTSVSVGFSSRSVSSSFRYPGSEQDQRIHFRVEPGQQYIARVVGSDTDPRWRIEVVSAEDKQVVSEVVETRPSEYPGEPFTRYFQPTNGERFSRQ